MMAWKHWSEFSCKLTEKRVADGLQGFVWMVKGQRSVCLAQSSLCQPALNPLSLSVQLWKTGIHGTHEKSNEYDWYDDDDNMIYSKMPRV